MSDMVSRLGRLVSGTHHSRGEENEKATSILPIGMEMIINLFGDGFADAANPLKLAEPGAGDNSCRAEMAKQRLLASRADPSDLVERRASQRFCSLGTMRPDREAMRLVAQALQEVKDGVARVE